MAVRVFSHLEDWNCLRRMALGAEAPGVLPQWNLTFPMGDG